MSRSPHVLLNALYLAPGQSGGPETYLRGLAPALAHEFPDLRLTIATTRSGAASLAADGFGEFATLAALPCEDGQRLRRQWAEQILLGPLARRRGVDVVHSLANLAPVLPLARSVVTLHDVTFMLTRTFSRATTLAMSALVRAAAHRADALITGSAAAREEICAVLGTDPTRFTVVHHGHERERPVAAAPVVALRERLELGPDTRVVLCVAAKRPHKNQELLIRAAEQLEDDVAVVLVGHPEPYERELRALTSRLGLDARVRFPGYVSDADLEGLWALAGCAAFPTLAEGFGIPLIEAFAHGVPVACSRLPVFEEIGGSLPHYFDPHDPADAARATREALSDRATAAAGPQYADRFSWAAAARETHAVYERVMA